MLNFGTCYINVGICKTIHLSGFIAITSCISSLISQRYSAECYAKTPYLICVLAYEELRASFLSTEKLKTSNGVQKKHKAFKISRNHNHNSTQCFGLTRQCYSQSIKLYIALYFTSLSQLSRLKRKYPFPQFGGET